MVYELPLNEDGTANLARMAIDYHSASITPVNLEHMFRALAAHYEARGAKHKYCRCACEFDDAGDTVINWCLAHAEARKDAVLKEREACAKIAEEEFYVDKSARPASIPVQTTAWAIRDAIRARSASQQGTEKGDV